ncbi:ATP-binding cassette domain-containing protein, partial [Corynebacterium diphtheriae]
MSLLTVHDVHRSSPRPAGDVPVLRGVSLQVPEGGVHAIMGPSGSGKSTLLRLLACLDTPDAGSIRVAGRSLPAPWSSDGDAYRNRTCGIVLQDHLLIDRATAMDNAALPPDCVRRLPRRGAGWRSSWRRRCVHPSSPPPAAPGRPHGGTRRKDRVMSLLTV